MYFSLIGREHADLATDWLNQLNVCSGLVSHWKGYVWEKKEMAVSISYKLYIKAENSYAYFDEIR